MNEMENSSYKASVFALKIMAICCIPISITFALLDSFHLHK